MKRRTVLQWGALAGATVGCGGGGSSPTPPPGPTPSGPNILMISIDDLNDWVGFLGTQAQVITPGMDALAARSTVFRHAYCNAPVCSASRASALSGLSPQSTRVFDNNTNFAAQNPAKRQFDQMLEAAGYRVARTGKIDHLYTEVEQPTPSPIPYSNHGMPGIACYLPVGGGAFDWGPAPGPESEMPDAVYAQRGIDFINAQDGKTPFCLSVGFVRTHVGWWAPQRFFDMYPPASEIVLPYAPADDLNDLGPMGRAIALKFRFHECITGQHLWSDAVRAYMACITWVDSQVGRLIAALDASPHAKNTVVVLWSDHGFHLGEKFHWHKMALWEHCTRVPFLIRMPGQSTGQAVTQVVSLQDMAPTILDICQVEPDYPMEGRSLSPLVSQPNLPWDHPVLTTLTTTDPDDLRHAYAIRNDRWRYIRYPTGEKELYDESIDAAEYHNLAGVAGHEDLMASLDALMPPVPT